MEEELELDSCRASTNGFEQFANTTLNCINSFFESSDTYMPFYSHNHQRLSLRLGAATVNYSIS